MEKINFRVETYNWHTGRFTHQDFVIYGAAEKYFNKQIKQGAGSVRMYEIKIIKEGKE